jgi:hypothetical protein
MPLPLPTPTPKGKEYSDFLTTLCYDNILTITAPGSRM